MSYTAGILSSFAIEYHHATAHGVLTAVRIPDSPDPVPSAVVDRLPHGEAEYARTLRGYRQVQFVGGRIALRRACEQIGLTAPDILPNARGAPSLPEGFVGSISHKRTIAVGMVARDTEGTLGVDVEDYEPMRPSIEKAVLTDEERRILPDEDSTRRWIATVMRFSIKEAIYKALDPYVERYVGFHEAHVTPDLHGHAAVQLHLAKGEGPFCVDARYVWLHGRLLTSVRIRPD